jgi:hypothetical protein
MNINRIMWPLALAAAVLGTGCAQLKAGAYNPSYESVDQLRKTQPAKVAVAEVLPSDAKAPVNQISLRGASMITAKGTFAAYLQDAMIADFKEISIYDPQADTRINATILKNDVDVSGFSTGTGTIEVELIVVRGQSQRLKKRYMADTKFESSFAGAIAIPKALGEYPTLVRALLAKVYTDPEFVKALQP